MTNDYIDPDDNQPKMATLPRKEVRRLEKLAQEGKEAQQELAQLKKERAFVQAGVPLDDRRAGYFIAGYQGEMTPEAIKAKWTEDFGAAMPQGDPAVAQEVAAMNAAQDLATAGGDLSESMLAERNRKWAEISPSDPRAPEKFDAIFAEYGGQMAAQAGMRGGLPHNQ